MKQSEAHQIVAVLVMVLVAVIIAAMLVSDHLQAVDRLQREVSEHREIIKMQDKLNHENQKIIGDLTLELNSYKEILLDHERRLP